jgi:hypothetical protein
MFFPLDDLPKTLPNYRMVIGDNYGDFFVH